MEVSYLGLDVPEGFEAAPVVSVLPELMPELLLSLFFFILQLSATISMLLTVNVCAFLPAPPFAPEDALAALELPEAPVPVSPVTRTSCPLCAERSWVLLS